MTIQAPDSVVMIRPLRFAPNAETAADNFFQARAADASPASPSLADAAYGEVTRMAKQLLDLGIEVHLFDDPLDHRPDSVFPNNWFSTHPDGRVALYPMFAPSRRAERRSDIIAALRSRYHITSVHDYSVLEDDEMYLEGTGAMVLDHVHRVAYTARSFRSHERAVDLVCSDLGYKPVKFATRDLRGAPIYHTNVMMSVGTTVAVVALDAIADIEERRCVDESLRATGHAIVALSLEQVDAFAGNTIEVASELGPRLLMSARGHESLTTCQRRTISEHAEIVPISVPTIELAGGSVRCMVAGIHLPLRDPRSGVATEADLAPTPTLAMSKPG
jgi:hypothetical protein